MVTHAAIDPAIAVHQGEPMRPAGFRETEIGPIPDDWSLVPIGSLLSFKNGLNKAKGFFGRGTPIVNYMDVFSHPGLRASNVAGKVELSKKEIENFSARKGDVFFTRTSETLDEIGVASVLLEDINDAVFSGFVLRGRPIADDLTNEFKKYCFASEPVRRQIVSKGTYTTRALTNGRILSRVLLPYPPLKKEQEAIASALSDVDALIASLETLINKKRAIQQGAMQDLLTGNRRLAGYKADWKEVTLHEIGEVLNGLTYSPANVQDGGTLVLRSSNIQEGNLSFDNNVFVKMDIPEQCRVRENDILICVRNGSRNLIGKTAKIDRRCDGMAFGAFMAVFRTHLYNFILYQFRSSAMKKQISERLGATINQITNSSLKSFIVRLPPTDDEARAIGGVLSEMDEEIACLTRQLSKLSEIKSGMMRELLTGRIRLL